MFGGSLPISRRLFRGGAFRESPIGVATPTYYLLDASYSVIGTGDASGTNIRPVSISSTGGVHGTCDFDEDRDVDADDFTALSACFTGPGVAVTVGGCEDKDIDGDDDVDAADYVIFQSCMSGAGAMASADCLGGVTPADSGMFALHGRPIDILPDGHMLMYGRARYFLPKHGRWLQRDPKGYVDGPNLYQAFNGNPLAYRDPMGTQNLFMMDADTARSLGEGYQALGNDVAGTLSHFGDATEDAIAEPLGAGLAQVRLETEREFNFMQDMGHVVFRLPGDAIFAREQSIARLEGRSVDYGLLHMTGRWAHFHGGFDGMVDGLNRFDLTNQRKLNGVQSAASFSGGLGAYSSVWAGGVSAFSAGPRIVQAARVASAAAGSGRSLGYALRLGMRFRNYTPGRGIARIASTPRSQMYQRVMSNIRKSRAARQASNFGTYAAYRGAPALNDVRFVAGLPVELLEGGLDVVIPPGTHGLRNTMSQLTARTGREVALLRMKDGTRILRMGSKSSVPLHGGVRRVIAHTHPSRRLSFSDADIDAMSLFRQHSSVLIDPWSDMGLRLLVPGG